MRTAGLVLLLALAAAAADPVAVEIAAPEECFAGQSVRAALRIRVDPGARLLQLFPIELELPLQVEASWLDPLEEGEGPRLVLNERIVRAKRTGKDTFELACELRPAEKGPLVLEGATVRYAFATRFREDFVHGPVPLDRHEAVARAEALTIAVRPLPQTSLPFTGAVGRFRISATTSLPAVDVGDTLKLVLTIEGEGNLAHFDPPRPELPGFHILGFLDDRATPKRTVRYDLEVLDAAVTAVPSIPLVYFDPVARAYRTVHTGPIPIDVRGGAPPDEDGFAWLLPAALALLAALAACWVARTRRAGRFDALAERDPAGALTAYLASRLRCPEASVIAPDLARRLVDRGVPQPLAERTAQLLEVLVAARYGGGAAPPDAARSVRALLHDLKRAFDRCFPSSG